MLQNKRFRQPEKQNCTAFQAAFTHPILPIRMSAFMPILRISS
ncbi:hypothetical protein [Simonsiella muelleri]|nr:hypothetical protein [Simonsiella muelleri]